MPCVLAVSEIGEATLNCSKIFDVTTKLMTSYTLTVGTELGFSDVIRYRVFYVTVFSFDVGDVATELFVIVSAVYSTGAEVTYRERFPIDAPI